MAAGRPGTLPDRLSHALPLSVCHLLRCWAVAWLFSATVGLQDTTGTVANNSSWNRQRETRRKFKDLRCFIHCAVTMNNRWLIDMQYITRYAHTRGETVHRTHVHVLPRGITRWTNICEGSAVISHLDSSQRTKKGETQRCGERGRSKARQRKKTHVQYVRNRNVSYKSYIIKMVQKASFRRSPDGECCQDVQWF